MKKITVKQIALLGVFAAAAYAVMFATRWLPPLIPAVPFLKYDPKDVIIAICGFIFGPLPALAVAVVVSLIEMITVSGTGFIGLLMNVLSTAAFVCPAALIYSKKRSIAGAIIGLIAGTVMMCIVMLLWNYIVTPIYMGYPREAVAKLLLPAFLPFNLIKAIINAALTLLIYKPLVIALRKAHLLPESPAGEAGAKRPWGILILALLLLATATLLILIFNHII
ncbi:MAG: ECF transporter S component [Lachnospiraceae bacterium]|nr:ECF transporter S component [Lachnospiraceae bacterium]